MSIEYRVAIRREDTRPKYRKFVQWAAVQRLLVLLGDQPWKAWAPEAEADEIECCDGYMCACRGMTYAEGAAAVRKGMPRLESVTIQQREVGPWADCAQSRAKAGEDV